MITKKTKVKTKKNDFIGMLALSPWEAAFIKKVFEHYQLVLNEKTKQVEVDYGK